MIRKKLEAYHMLGIEIDSFNGMLDDCVVKKYSHHKSVREYKSNLLEYIEQVKRKRDDIINLINSLEDPY